MRLYAMSPPLVTACLPDVPPPAQADAVGGAAGTNAEGAHPLKKLPAMRPYFRLQKRSVDDACIQNSTKVIDIMSRNTSQDQRGLVD